MFAGAEAPATFKHQKHQHSGDVQGPPSLAPSKETHLGDTHQVEELLQLLVCIVDAELLKAVELKHLKPVDSRDRPEGATRHSHPSQP